MNAKDYCDNHWIKNKVWERLSTPKHIRRLSFIAKNCTGNTVLDVGCASGHSSNMIMKYLGRKARIIGIDQSREVIDLAKGLFPAIEFIYCKDNAMPFEDKFIDTAVCSEVIEHVENDKELVGEVLRISKRAIFSTPSVRVKDPGHLRLYEKKDLDELFGKNVNIVNHWGFWFILIGGKNEQFKE